jgi:hypothetical protein
MAHLLPATYTPPMTAQMQARMTKARFIFLSLSWVTDNDLDAVSGSSG